MIEDHHIFETNLVESDGAVSHTTEAEDLPLKVVVARLHMDRAIQEMRRQALR